MYESLKYNVKTSNKSMIDLRVFYEDMGCQPPNDVTSPDSTDFSQNLLSKDNERREMTGVEEAANMV